MKIDLELIRKYNVPGPRYTSYPTAPHFSPDVSSESVTAALQKSLSDPSRDLSLYFHIPFCDSLCYFCGCTTTVTRNPLVVDLYLADLRREMDIYQPWISSGRQVRQIHFGGGTPTHLSPEQLSELGRDLHSRFSIADDAEISCEIDPRELTENHIAALRAFGTNRISLGVQDFEEKVQRAVNRVQDEDLVRTVVDWTRKHGIDSLNLDLIYGLPHQTVEGFSRTLDKVLNLHPDRLAIFNFAYVPWMKPHQKLIPESALPAPDTKLAMLSMMIDRLESEGYVYIGMDHFAKVDDELAVAQRSRSLQRNFQGYSTRSGLDILAFGMSSISQYRDLYVQNVKDLKSYHDSVLAGHLPVEKALFMSRDDRMRQELISELMCNLYLNFHDFGEKWAFDPFETLADELSQLRVLEADGLLQLQDGVLQVTHTGRLFLRNIAMLFDVYLPSDTAVYSRTV